MTALFVVALETVNRQRNGYFKIGRILTQYHPALLNSTLLPKGCIEWSC